MNSGNDPIVNRASGAAFGFVVAGLIFVVLVVVVKFSVHVPAIDADAPPRAPRRWRKSAPTRTNR